MTQAVKGVGSIVKLEGVTIEEVLNLNGPALQLENIEVTSLNSPGAYKEFIGGLRDAGSLSFSLNWINTVTQQALRAAFISSELGTYSVTLADGTEYTATGTIETFDMATEANAAITADVSIRLNSIIWGEYTPPPEYFLLLESGDSFLIESGDSLILEN